MQGGERGGAAIRCPLGLEGAEVAYEVSLPLAARHTLRIQGSEPDRVYLVQVDARRVTLMRQPLESEPSGNIMMAEGKLQLPVDSWARIRVQVSNREIAAQVNDTAVRASHLALDGQKTAFALMAFGRGVGFRNLVVRQVDPQQP
jgi:hypothetical protein